MTVEGKCDWQDVFYPWSPGTAHHLAALLLWGLMDQTQFIGRSQCGSFGLCVLGGILGQERFPVVPGADRRGERHDRGV